MDYSKAILHLVPGARMSWSGDGSDYDAIEWLDDRPKPSKAELDAAWPEVEAARTLAAQQQARAAAYQSESDPLFFKWQRGEGTEQEWLDAVASIRDRYPY
jgi:hypothetical protein